MSELLAESLKEVAAARVSAVSPGCWIGILTVHTSMQRYGNFMRRSTVSSAVTERKEASFLYAQTVGCPCKALTELSQRVGFTRTCHKLFACDKETTGTLAQVLDHIVADEALNHGRVRLHCTNRAQQIETGNLLDASASFAERGALLSPGDFTVVLVLIELKELQAGRWAYGIWTAEQYRESLGAGQAAVPRGGTFQLGGLNHAEYKMQEAVQVLAEHRECVDHSHAIDVGAAPGGWTRFLAVTRNFHLVTAIDPGELFPEVLALENVIHKQMPAQEVGDLPHSSLLVCDVNRDPRDVAKDMLMPLATKLRPGGGLIMTLKFPKRMPEGGVQHWSNEVENILSGAFELFELLWLFGNTYNERTMICFKKAETYIN